MPHRYNKWYKISRDELGAAQILYEKSKYRQAVFNLQQAYEKASKGLLMRMGFLPAYEEPVEIREARRIVGVPPSSPKDYGHEWHRKMIEVLEDFIESFDKVAKGIIELKLVGRKEIENISEFRKMIVPDFRRRIQRAKKVKINPNPSLQELDEVIRYYNKHLDSALKAEHRVRAVAHRIRLPDKRSVLKTIEKRLRVKIDKDTLMKIDRIYERDPVDLVTHNVTFSETLIVLAVLNTYLLPHEWISRYPDTKTDVVYDENFSIIRRFKQLSDLLERCLELASGSD